MAKKEYSAAQRRTIKLCKERGMSTKDTATKVNSLKATIKSGESVSQLAIAHAFKRCQKENW
jgi:hypothetical protein